MRTSWVMWLVAGLGLGASAHVAPGANPAPELVPSTVLAFDAELKQVDAGATNPSAAFTFWVTNVSTTNVLILGVTSSCGCTVAQLPAQPWILPPLESGPIHVTLDLRGRHGIVLKAVEINSSAGIKDLVVRANLPPLTNTPAVSSLLGGSSRPALSVDPQHLQERARNLQAALADRQALFRGDCVRCHVEPARGKTGCELYLAACGICHQASPRAAVVPDLHQSAVLRSNDTLRKTIALGRPGSLMPAFALAEKGPLTEAQVDSLVDYLSARAFGLEARTNSTPAQSPAEGARPSLIRPASTLRK